MTLRRFIPIFLLVLLAGTGAVYVRFTFKSNITVFDSSMEVNPESFSVDIAKGGHYVRQVKVKNTGAEKEIYFEDTIEGPDPHAIDVSYHTIDGTTINSGNKLHIPAGSPDSPAEIKVNVHIDVDDDAPLGEYTVYIHARS